jgi:hypothetical protein
MIVLLLTAAAMLISVAATTALITLLGDVAARRSRPAHGLPTFRRATRDLVAGARWILRRASRRRPR